VGIVAYGALGARLQLGGARVLYSFDGGTTKIDGWRIRVPVIGRQKGGFSG